MNESENNPAEKLQRKNEHIAPMLHFKRMGRELAMQYLFQCDLAGNDNLSESLENFWTQAEESGQFPSNRIFRKARNYAEKIIAGVYEHEQEIFELEFCPDIPALVSIDEAIEISKDFSSEKSGIFINGILNGVKDSLPAGAKNPPGQKTNGEND